MSINLLPWRETQRQQRQRRLAREAGLVLMTILVGTLLWQVHDYRSLTRQKLACASLEQTVRNLSVAYADAVKQRQQYALLAREEAFLSTQLRTNQQLLTLLSKVAPAMPMTIYLTALQKNNRIIYLLGKAPSHTELALFLKQMAAQIHQQPLITETTHPSDQSAGIDFKIGYEI